MSYKKRAFLERKYSSITKGLGKRHVSTIKRSMSHQKKRKDTIPKKRSFPLP